ncbi:peptidoglycan-binding protein [Actinokineospora iranica]|uniref:Putative peptidoglycan binding domain-containing protein n=1 Tax=Actinokineospora iranica TaxID=1271860 RepID=A0A1G6TAC7_9PSEU|nr:peptidoglycan-binding protein [Actinokineospora iranica]SDD25969.1 Putative peptidoglycan binding domain-containing protein [Actinokineospora iranica]
MTGKPARRRWVVAAVVITGVAALAITAAGFVGPLVKSPRQAAADAAPPPASLVTARAESRVLSETVVLRGTVVEAPSTKVAPPTGLAGPDAVVTDVFIRPGDVLREGKAFLEVAGAPLFGLVLPFPLYRDITDGMSGPDVRELQKSLARLGFATAQDGVFGVATQSALARFYQARGYESPTSAAAAKPPAADAPVVTPPADKPTVRRAHIVRLDRPDPVVSAVSVAVGDVLADPAAPVVELDAGTTTITALATAVQAAQATPGTQARITDDVRGLQAKAAVRSVGTEPKQTEAGTGLEVLLVFTEAPMAPTANHTVRVTLGESEDATAVLAVPVTAVYSRPDGSRFVTVAADAGNVADVAVRTGRAAGGWVEIIAEQGGVQPGDDVVVGSELASGPAK